MCVNCYLLFAASQPSLQAQSGSSPSALRQVKKPTSNPAVAKPLIRPYTIKFGPFQQSSSRQGSQHSCETSSTPTAAQVQPPTTSSPSQTESHLPPPVTRAANEEMQPQSTLSRQASTECPSKGSNEALARSVHKKFVEKGKGGNQGNKKKECKPNSGTSSQSSSWQDCITFDANEDALTIGKVHSFLVCSSNLACSSS